MNWLFWQAASAPYIGGGFGHFYCYAPANYEYAIDRFTMETKRQLDVLDKQLEGKQFVCAGDEPTIADFAIFPWSGHSPQSSQSYHSPRSTCIDAFSPLFLHPRTCLRARPPLTPREAGIPSRRRHSRHLWPYSAIAKVFRPRRAPQCKNPTSAPCIIPACGTVNHVAQVLRATSTFIEKKRTHFCIRG